MRTKHWLKLLFDFTFNSYITFHNDLFDIITLWPVNFFPMEFIEKTDDVDNHLNERANWGSHHHTKPSSKFGWNKF